MTENKSYDHIQGQSQLGRDPLDWPCDYFVKIAICRSQAVYVSEWLNRTD